MAACVNYRHEHKSSTVYTIHSCTSSDGGRLAACDYSEMSPACLQLAVFVLCHRLHSDDHLYDPRLVTATPSLHGVSELSWHQASCFFIQQLQIQVTTQWALHLANSLQTACLSISLHNCQESIRF